MDLVQLNSKGEMYEVRTNRAIKDLSTINFDKAEDVALSYYGAMTLLFGKPDELGPLCAQWRVNFSSSGEKLFHKDNNLEHQKVTMTLSYKKDTMVSIRTLEDQKELLQQKDVQQWLSKLLAPTSKLGALFPVNLEETGS